jgi:hypothetical protein
MRAFADTLDTTSRQMAFVDGLASFRGTAARAVFTDVVLSAFDVIIASRGIIGVRTHTARANVGGTYVVIGRASRSIVVVYTTGL